MPKASPGILGFTTGLNSPATTGRIDLPTYHFGCLTLENFLVEVEGPVAKRPGAKYIAPAKFDDKTTRLFRFVFSDEQPYALEFGDLYMRVHRLQSTVLDSAAGRTGTILSITAADPMVITTSGHSILVDEHVFVTGTTIDEINDVFFRVTAVTATDLTLEFDSSTLTAQPGAAGTAQAVFEIVTPYVAADIRTIKTAPSIDVLYPTSPNVLPQKLIRLADDDWTINPIWTSANLENTEDDQLGLWLPFGNLQLNQSITIEIGFDGAPGVTVNAEASAALFVASDVGRFLKVKGTDAQSGFGEITAFVNSTNVTVTVKSRFPTSVITTPTKAWAFDAFSDVNGFPRAIAFFEDRLFFAGTSELPQSWWASISGAFENFRPYSDDGSGGFTIAADSSIFNTIASDQQNPIEWLLGQETLFAGSRGGEFTIEGANIEQGIQPGNLFVKKRASFGSRKDVQAVAVDTVVLFCQRAGRRIRELAYRLENDRYFAPDMNRMSREAVFGRITEMSYQQEPNRVLWCRMEDGTFASFTYEREEQVTAWATQQLGGSSVLIESVAAVPSSNGDEDEVWVVVNRTFDGVTRQTIEVFSDFWDRSQVQEDAVFMDSAVCFDLETHTVTSVVYILTTQTFLFYGEAVGYQIGDVLEVVSDPLTPGVVGKLLNVVALNVPLNGTSVQFLDGSVPTADTGPSVGAVMRLTTERVTGAVHLAGQTVGLTLGGRVEEDVTVDSVGVVTLPRPSGQGCVGHKYESRLRTNRVEAGAADGIAQGKTGRVHRVVLRLDQTGPGLFLGSNFDDEGNDSVMDLVELQQFETVEMDAAIPLFDGDTRSLAMPAKYDQLKTIALKHIEPVPCTIIAIFPQLNVQDR